MTIAYLMVSILTKKWVLALPPMRYIIKIYEEGFYG